MNKYTTGSNRIIHGGTWLYIDSGCQVVCRGQKDPDQITWDMGFRLVRIVE